MNLVGYSPWGHTESDTIEWRTLSLRIWKIQQCWCLNLLKSNLDAEKHQLKWNINFYHAHIILKYFPLIKIFSSRLMGNNKMSQKWSSREAFPIYLCKSCIFPSKSVLSCSSVYKSRSSHTFDPSVDLREDTLKASDANWASAERKGKNYILYLKYLGSLRLAKKQTNEKPETFPRILKNEIYL